MPVKKESYPWIIMDVSGPEKGCRCTRCNAFYAIKMPIRISEFDRLGLAFVELHKNCKEKK